MPAAIVKPGEEAIWDAAREAAAKQGRGDDYGYVTAIFRRMAGLAKALGDPLRMTLRELLEKAEQLGLFDRPARAPAAEEPAPAAPAAPAAPKHQIATGPRGGKITGYSHGKPTYGGTEGSARAPKAPKKKAQPKPKKPPPVRPEHLSHEAMGTVRALFGDNSKLTGKQREKADQRNLGWLRERMAAAGTSTTWAWLEVKRAHPTVVDRLKSTGRSMGDVLNAMAEIRDHEAGVHENQIGHTLARHRDRDHIIQAIDSRGIDRQKYGDLRDAVSTLQTLQSSPDHEAHVPMAERRVHNDAKELGLHVQELRHGRAHAIVHTEKIPIGQRHIALDVVERPGATASVNWQRPNEAAYGDERRVGGPEALPANDQRDEAPLPPPVDPAFWEAAPKFGVAGGPLEHRLTEAGNHRAIKVATGLDPKAFAALHSLHENAQALEERRGSKVTLTPWGAQHGSQMGHLGARGLVELAPAVRPGPERTYRITDKGREMVRAGHLEQARLLQRVRAAHPEAVRDQPSSESASMKGSDGVPESVREHIRRQLGHVRELHDALNQLGSTIGGRYQAEHLTEVFRGGRRETLNNALEAIHEFIKKAPANGVDPHRAIAELGGFHPPVLGENGRGWLNDMQQSSEKPWPGAKEASQFLERARTHAAAHPEAVAKSLALTLGALLKAEQMGLFGGGSPPPKKKPEPAQTQLPIAATPRPSPAPAGKTAAPSAPRKETQQALFGPGTEKQPSLFGQAGHHGTGQGQHVIKVGPRGGQIVGYLHGDPKKPIYLDDQAGHGGTRGEEQKQDEGRKPAAPQGHPPGGAGVLGPERSGPPADRSADGGARGGEEKPKPTRVKKPTPAATQKAIEAVTAPPEQGPEAVEHIKAITGAPTVAATIDLEPPQPALPAPSAEAGQAGKWSPPSNPAITLHEDLLPEIHEEARLPEHVKTFPNPQGRLTALFPHQVEAAERILTAWREGDGCLLQDQAGLGKQHPIDTKVPTPSGWRRIGDVRIGDPVFGSSGAPTEVTGVFPQGVKPSYRVRFSDGSSVEAGPEHLWTVGYRPGGKRWDQLVLTTEQLRTRPVIEVQYAHRRAKLNLEKTTLYLPMLSAPLEYAGTKELPIGPYTMGQLIGNGSLAHGTPALSTNTQDWAEVREQIVQEGEKIGATQVYGGTTRMSILERCETIRQLELDLLSREKFIPRIYLEARAEDRVRLLNALMDTDGACSKTRNRLTFHSTSERLAADVIELVEGLGGIARSSAYDRADEGKPIEYNVRIRLPMWVKPFTVKRKADRYRPGRMALPVRTVVAVEYVRDVESVCIRVAADDSLYATEHAILTHNTNSALATLVAHGGKRTMIIVPTSGKANLKKQWAESAGLYGIKTRDLSDTSGEGTWLASYDDIVEYEIDEASGKKKAVLHHALRNGERFDAVVFDESHSMAGYGSRAMVGIQFQDYAQKALYLSATPYTNVTDMHYLVKLGEFHNADSFREWAEKAGCIVEGKEIKNPSSPLPMAAIAATFHVDGKALKRTTSLEGVHSYFEEVQHEGLTPEAKRTFEEAQTIVDHAITAGIPQGIARALYVGWSRQFWETQKADRAIQLGKKAIQEGKQVAFYTSFIATEHAHLKAYPRILERWALKASEEGDEHKAAQLHKHALELAERIKTLPVPPSIVKTLTDAFGGPGKVAELHGATSKKADKEQDRYQSGAAKVCVATMAKGGTGISLHDTVGNAPRVQINLSLPWSGREFTQVAGRSHRLGSKSETEMRWLVGESDMEKANAGVVAKRLKSMGSLTTGDPDFQPDSNVLAAWDNAMTSTEATDDANEAVKVIEADAVESTGQAAKEAELSRDHFRTFGEARRSGRDVLGEEHARRTAAKRQLELREAKRAAEQIRIHTGMLDWHFDPHPAGGGDFILTPRGYLGDLYKPVATHGGPYNKYLKHFRVPLPKMEKLAQKLGAHKTHVDLSKLVERTGAEIAAERAAREPAAAAEPSPPQATSSASPSGAAAPVVSSQVANHHLAQKRIHVAAVRYPDSADPVYLLGGNTFANREVIKRFAPGGRFDGATKCWPVPASKIPALLSRLGIKHDLSKALDVAIGIGAGWAMDLEDWLRKAEGGSSDGAGGGGAAGAGGAGPHSGEGSRGGRVIGHTASGKPIYEVQYTGSKEWIKSPHSSEKQAVQWAAMHYHPSANRRIRQLSPGVWHAHNGRRGLNHRGTVIRTRIHGSEGSEGSEAAKSDRVDELRKSPAYAAQQDHVRRIGRVEQVRAIDHSIAPRNDRCVDAYGALRTGPPVDVAAVFPNRPALTPPGGPSQYGIRLDADGYARPRRPKP